MTTILTEEEFIGRLKQGKEDAYRVLVSQYSDRIYNTVLGLTQQREDAEDITQEVFSEIFRSVQKFRGQSKLSTWIYRIAVTKSLEFLRNNRREKRSAVTFSLFGKEHQLNVSNDGPFYHPGIRMENKEMAAVLFSAIKKLPLNQRTAFTLHKLEQLSNAELSDVMGVSLSSVESLLFRAKRNLQDLLRNYYEEYVK